MTQQRKRATIREVAKATGLSPAAVSYALRGIQTSEETQERVRKAAEELGYEAHPIARALASGRSGMVGLLCGSLEDLWQQSLAVGIGRALFARDRFAIILDAAGDPERELMLARQLRDQRVDGLIVQPVDPSASLWAELGESLPLVSIGDSLPGGHAYGEVVFDNRAGVTLALEHLYGLGHRHIAVLTPTFARTPDRPADVHVEAEARAAGRQGRRGHLAAGPGRGDGRGPRRAGRLTPADGAVLLLRLDRLRRLRGDTRAGPGGAGRRLGDGL